MRRRTAPRHLDVRGLRVTLATEHRRASWWHRLTVLSDPFGRLEAQRVMVTVRDAAGREVARRHFATDDEAQHVRDRFVAAVEAMGADESARTDLAALLVRLAAEAPPRGEVMVVEDEGYVVPAVQGIAVDRVVVDGERVALHAGSSTVVLAGPAPEGLRGAVCARLVLRRDGRLVLHLADGRRLEAPSGWEVAVRGRTVAAARPGGVRLLPGHRGAG